MSIEGPEFVYWKSKKPRQIRLNQLYSDSLSNDYEVNRFKSQFVTIETSNGRQFEVYSKPSTRLQELFDAVVQQLSIAEHFYFGLCWINNKEEYFFLDLNDSVQDVASDDWMTGKLRSFKLLFLIKFYLRDESWAKNEVTKQLLYWQIRRDILEDRLDCSEVDSILFAAIALQSEYGNFSEEKFKRIYVKYYVAESVINYFGESQLLDELSKVYKSYFGFSKQDAESHFIQEAAKIPDYGCFFYQLIEPKCSILGVSSSKIMGVHLDSDMYRKNSFSHTWDEILHGNLSGGDLTFTFKGSNPKTSGLSSRMNLSGSNQILRLSFGDDNYKAFYVSQLCNVFFKLSHAFKVQSLDLDIGEKLRKSYSVPLLFSNLNPNIFIDEDAKKIQSFRAKTIGQTLNWIESNNKNEGNQSQKRSFKDELAIRKVETVSVNRNQKQPIGIELDYEKLPNSNSVSKSNNLVIRGVTEGTHAFQLKKSDVLGIGDRVLAVNGISTEGFSPKDAQDLIQNSKTPIQLILSRVKNGNKHKHRVEHSDSCSSESVLELKFENPNFFPNKADQKLESVSRRGNSIEKTSENSPADSIFKDFDYPPITEEEKTREIERIWSKSRELQLKNNHSNFQTLQTEKDEMCSSLSRDDVFLSPIDVQVEQSKPYQTPYHGEYFKVDLPRIDGGIGIVLCENVTRSGIFVRSLSANGSADLDGRIKPGDRVCKIHEIPLGNDFSLDEAIKLLQKAPQVVRLELQRWVLPINVYKPKRRLDYSSFVNDSNRYFVSLFKELSRGNDDVDSLGFAVSGFADVSTDNPDEAFPRIKQLHMGGPAQQSGLIIPGDVILSVNGQPMNDHAYSDFVNAVRQSDRQVDLELCRPLPGLLIPISRCKTRNSALERDKVKTNQQNSENDITEFDVQFKKAAGESLGIVYKSLKTDSEPCEMFAWIKRVTEGGLTDRESNISPGDLIKNISFDSQNLTLHGNKSVFGDLANNTMKLMQKTEGLVTLSVVRKGESFKHLETCVGDEFCFCLFYKVAKSAKNPEENKFFGTYFEKSELKTDTNGKKLLVVRESAIQKPLFKIKGISNYFDSNLLHKIRDAKNDILSSEWRLQFEELNLEKLRKNVSNKNHYGNLQPNNSATQSEFEYCSFSYGDLGLTYPSQYIISQNPDGNSIEPFLDLIWKQRVEVVVTFKGPIKKQYWPTQALGKVLVRDFEVSVDNEDESDISKYLKLKIKRTISRSLTYVHLLIFKKWNFEDSSTFPATTELVQFVNIVRNLYREDFGGKILVHAEDTNNQAASIAALHIILKTVEFDHIVDIQNIVRYLRSQNAFAVTDERFYKFLYMCYIALIQSFHLFG